ncbi:MAG: sensor domain-containing diguanylate cyclase [Burkholderiaceae bacterium]
MLSKEQTYETCSRIIAVNSLDGLLNLLGSQIEALGLADGYLINLLDTDRACLVSRKIHYAAEFQSLEQVYLGHKNSLKDNYVNARAFQSRSIVRVNLQNAGAFESGIMRYWKADEIVAIPVAMPNDTAPPLGVIVLLKGGTPITEQQIAPLQELLALFHTSLANWMRYAQLEEMHDQEKAAVAENERLLQFLDELSGLTSVAKIYDLFAAQVFRQLHFDIAGFTLLKDGVLHDSYVAIADPMLKSIGEEWQQFMQETPFPHSPALSGASYVLSRGEAMVFPDVQQIMHLQIAKHDLKILTILKTARTLFISPIRHQKKAIGVFALYSLTKPVALSEADMQLLERLSSFLGTAITNSQIYATSQKQNIEIGYLNERLQEKVVKLAEQASTDELTGLFNFRTFEIELEKSLHESKRASDKKELSLLLIDIDHFKNFNDTYGHAAGNDVLAGVALEISKLIRQTDKACRYGGEEFVVILPNCDLSGATLLAERIRSTMEKHLFTTSAGMRSVTVSIGCANSRPDDTYDTFFARVDGALYQAKNTGRNRICVT